MSHSLEHAVPEGWAITELVEVTLKVANTKPEEEPQRVFHYVDISGISNESFEIVGTKEFPGADAPSRARRPIRSGDVLFSNVRTYLKNIAVVPDELDDQVASTGFTLLRPNGAVLTKYLYHWVLTDQFVDTVTPQQTGSSYPATTDRVVRDQTIPLPPLAEQERIVGKVEALLSQVRSVRQRLAAVPDILKRFRQSILTNACSGKLTEDWREEGDSVGSGDELVERIADNRRQTWKREQATSAAVMKKYPEPTQLDVADLPKTPENWTWETLDQIGQEGRPIVYGIIKPGPHTPAGVPYVRITEMREGVVAPLGQLRRASPERAMKFKRSKLAAGDVLISKDGTIGKVAVVPPELEGGNVTQHVMRAPIHRFMDRDYVVAAIRAPHAQRWLTGELLGVALQGVNVKDFRRLPLPIPPLCEQCEIVRRVEALLQLADTIEERVAVATKRAETLTQSILAKAFRGELVPTEADLARAEGRTYELASELLARIQAERGNETAATKCGGKKASRQRKRNS